MKTGKIALKLSFIFLVLFVTAFWVYKGYSQPQTQKTGQIQTASPKEVNADA